MRRRAGTAIFPLLTALALASGPGFAQDSPGPAPLVLSLDECLRQALENNLDIVVRRYDPLRSEAQVRLQQSVFDPTLGGTATSAKSTDPRSTSFFRSDQGETYTASFDDPLITGGHYRFEVTGSDDKPVTLLSPNGDPQYNTNWLLTVTQPLLRNFGPKASRWQIVVAKSNLGISAAQFRQTVIDTLSNAEKAYWDLNFSLMDLMTKQGSLRLAQDFLDQNRIKVRVGTLAPIEITQAEAGVASREEEVIVAENAVQMAEDAIRRIMNVPPDSPIWSQPIRPGDPPPVQEVSPDMDAAVVTAQGSRPDLEQARQMVASRETELAFRRNQKRWGLDFKGTYGPQGFAQNNPPVDSHGSYGDAFRDLAEGGNANWSLGLSLSVPLGNRQATSNFTNAEYALTQARFDLERLSQAARVEVRNAVRTVSTNLKRVKAAQVNTRLQKEKLDAEQKKFENGMSTSFLVLQFQTDLATAQTGENQALIDYNKSLVELERVKGTLLEAKKMTVPADAGGAEGKRSAGGAAARPGSVATPGSIASASLRPLWRGEISAGPRLAETVAIDRLVLPESFVFTGGRILAAGGR